MTAQIIADRPRPESKKTPSNQRGSMPVLIRAPHTAEGSPCCFGFLRDSLQLITLRVLPHTCSVEVSHGRRPARRHRGLRVYRQVHHSPPACRRDPRPHADRASDRPNEFGDRIDVQPLAFDHPAALEESLRGADVLYNTYWIRFERGDRTFAQAVANTKLLFEAAEARGRAPHRARQHRERNVGAASPLLRRQGRAGGGTAAPRRVACHPPARPSSSATRTS